MTHAADLARTILVVDDDARFRERVVRALGARGLEVREARDYDSALAAAQEESPELVLVDLRMPGRSGLDVVRDIRQLDVSTRIVVLTGYGSIATALDAMRLGAHSYLTKPADVDAILAAFDEHANDPSRDRRPVDTPTLARVEWEHINRVLTDCGGNVSEAARRLGIHRRSLQRKLGKYPTAR
ncbi:MAG: response regulator [Luteitalea sp.]|nr:response regulator [Luteitalea sp.]